MSAYDLFKQRIHLVVFCFSLTDNRVPKIRTIFLFVYFCGELKKKSTYAVFHTRCLISFIVYKLNKISLEEYKEALKPAADGV